jgi:hypothetical protein
VPIHLFYFGSHFINFNRLRSKQRLLLSSQEQASFINSDNLFWLRQWLEFSSGFYIEKLQIIFFLDK